MGVLTKYLIQASMRPRLIAVDDANEQLDQMQIAQASMRPRLIAVDDGRTPAPERADLHPASMRPRLIAVDDPTP